MRLGRSVGPAVWILVGLMVVVGSGCASAPRQTAAMQQMSNLEISSAQLRVQVRSLARPFGMIIEESADRILAQTSDPDTRRVALRYKINGIPAVHGALFEPDPLAAAFETAVLLVQFRQFLEQGLGAGVPELARREALVSVAEMRSRMMDVARSIATTPDGAERFWQAAEEWAREHPVTGSFATRHTTQAFFVEFLDGESGGLRAAAGRLEESLADISLRIDLYAEFIAKQARWQAELLLEEALVHDVPSRMLANVGAIPVEFSSLPFDLEAGRDALLAAAAGERALILDWINAERLATLDFVSAERQAVAGLASAEREIVLAALRAERAAILGAIREERMATMTDLEEMLPRAMVQVRSSLVDHFFRRLAQLLAVVLPLFFVGAFVLIRYAKQPTS